MVWASLNDGFEDCCHKSNYLHKSVGHVQTFKDVFEMYFCSGGKKKKSPPSVQFFLIGLTEFTFAFTMCLNG